MGRRDGQHPIEARDLGADRHHRADAGRPGVRDHVLELVFEVREIEMAVTVNQHILDRPRTQLLR